MTIRYELVRIMKKFFYPIKKIDELLIDKQTIRIDTPQVEDLPEVDNSTLQTYSTVVNNKTKRFYRVKDNGLTEAKIQNNTLNYKKDIQYKSNGNTNDTSMPNALVKVLKITLTGTYLNQPITFDIYQRGRSEPTHVNLRFSNATAIPNYVVDTLYHTGFNLTNLFVYKEDDGVFIVVGSKSEAFDKLHLTNFHTFNDVGIVLEELNEVIPTLPETNVKQSEYIGYSTAEKTKLANIQNNANNYTHPDNLPVLTPDLYKITTNNNGHIINGTPIIIDNAPANNANNLISSKGVFDAINNVTSGSFDQLDQKADLYHSHGDITYNGLLGSEANKPLITGTKGKIIAGNFESSTSNIKMNGDVSVGVSNNFARSDHVHPSDTSKFDIAGTGLTDSGTTINHTNSIIAQNTQGLYKIKYDDTGHITNASSIVIDDTPTNNIYNLVSSKGVSDALDGKVAIAQGSGRSGQFLKVNSQGNVACEAVTIPTQYTHPSHSAHPNGLYKITVDNQGHVTAANSVTATDLPNMYDAWQTIYNNGTVMFYVNPILRLVFFKYYKQDYTGLANIKTKVIMAESGSPGNVTFKQYPPRFGSVNLSCYNPNMTGIIATFNYNSSEHLRDDKDYNGQLCFIVRRSSTISSINLNINGLYVY